MKSVSYLIDKLEFDGGNVIMKHLKILILFFIVILLMTTVSCSRKSSPYYFDYPKDVTPKYCFANYRAFDANIKYTECYEFITTRDRTERVSGFADVEYSAIKGVEDLSFTVYYKTIYWFGENRWIGVVRHRDCNIEPIMDYTPSKIELCTYEDIWIDVEENPQTYYNYATSTLSEPILTVNSQEAIAEIMAVAQRPTTMTTQENYKEQLAYPSPNARKWVAWENKPVYVKISFEECSGMVWIGQLFTDDEGIAYMERLIYVHGEEPDNKDATLHVGSTFPTPSGKSFYYPLGEHMNEILLSLEEMKK